MRLIHLAPTQFGSDGLFGGGERYPLELARALAAEVECELLTFGARSHRVREPGGLVIRCLRPIAWRGGHPAHPVAPSLPLALAGADIVHAHHLRSTPSRITALTSRMVRGRLVVTDHGLQGNSWAGILPRLVDRFLTVSAYSARELGVPLARARVIYGGADPERFKPDPSIVRRGVLFVGRVTPHKGIDTLISALPAGAHLTIAGATGNDPNMPEREYPLLLRKLADSHDVEFRGAVPDETLPALYRQAAVLVLPSVERTCYGRSIRVSELLGLAVLEAMASGTPVITSRIGGLPEIVQDGITGYLVEPGNVEQLHDRLAALLGNPSHAAWMGTNARERVLERFTWRACAERCLRAYQELELRSPS